MATRESMRVGMKPATNKDLLERAKRKKRVRDFGREIELANRAPMRGGVMSGVVQSLNRIVDSVSPPKKGGGAGGGF